jgi:hypothetical protein
VSHGQNPSPLVGWRSLPMMLSKLHPRVRTSRPDLFSLCRSLQQWSLRLVSFRPALWALQQALS